MEENNHNNGQESPNEPLHDIIPVSGMYENWFLDYASYVILERAVPAINDGLKPVQRRILHAMKEMDDGRYNKVANIIGSTMQYHPHGDMSIGDAMVNMGQKELLIDMQGNWGDVRTGDRAAASRYIEARPSKLALDILYNPQTTEWQLSYDGRKKEPVTLPVKFPLLLAQGVEGIAVGLSTKILPHNFCELIDASIKHLKGKSFKLYPDFQTGGIIDIEEYNKGHRGGKVKVRAKIEEFDKKQLVIKDIPFGTTTTSLIESIIKANDKGKIKIKKVIDNTAKDIEILVQLAPGVSPDITIDALYAFTDCQVSISPNACVIVDDKPMFTNVHEILRLNTDQTVNLLRQELEIRKGELLEKILFSSLEKIFIENRIYRDIEECETWEAVLETIDQGLEPFKSQFYRVITQDDIVRLTEIKIKRISKFDKFKADELMKRLEEELAQVEHDLIHIIDYSIAYYQNLLTKYGKGKERKTEISSIETIAATEVAANNAKLYANFKDGFIGFGLKKDEYISECSDLDDIIVFRKDGRCVVTRIQDKVFVGKDIIYAGVFKKNDERMVYNLAYLDGKSGRTMVKRFNVTSVTRDKEYNLTKSEKGSKVLYFTANPNGEAEVITVYLTAGAKARKKVFDFDIADIDIKGRAAGGNILTKYPVRKIDLKSEGKSTLAGTDIWFDESIGRLNRDERGVHLGNFNADDYIIVFFKDGSYELTSFELSNHYNTGQMFSIHKFDPDKIVSVLHQDGESKVVYVKRFMIETMTVGKTFSFIHEAPNSKLLHVSIADQPQVKVTYRKKGERSKSERELNLADLIDKKGWKSIGNKFPVQNISIVEEIQSEEEKTEEKGSTDVDPNQLSELKAEVQKEVEEEETKKPGFDVGSSIDLNTDKSNDDDEKPQLGLFE
ncbi:DNA gyrase/topoisomerase IV subunit A [Reichenbachiella carrageenanivorans]|uniref:DNA gyrase/topoisomerase IV subunit A n=1 Tax=Reichenbachiella carrageenanivorans TaxID=2979869 RepID=A0ABY6CXF9_9BACT|nr:DNA gyrase/topoisomerase IV subunit A [Reichenbachiella carrageenanivorans]UXX78587.1 DNA gyrase/topoisomerase IV subunit A [Reichenbachiella carrageenanivorans]